MATSTPETALFQEIEVVGTGGDRISTSMLLEGSYIEFDDLQGPQLILKVLDRNRYYRDNLRVARDTELKVRLADTAKVTQRELVETFVVLTAPESNDTITINAMAKPVWAAHQVAQRPTMYVNKPLKEVLQGLIPGAKDYQVSDNRRVTYHHLTGVPASRVLRRIAAELGVRIWYCRGVVHCEPIAQAIKGTPENTYHHGDDQQQLQLFNFQVPDLDALYRRAGRRHWITWDMTQGLVQSAADTDAQPTFTYCSPATIDQHGNFMKHILRFDSLGYLDIEPGLLLGLQFHRTSRDHPLDESVPPKATVTRVTHHQHGLNYLSNLDMGVPYREQ